MSGLGEPQLNLFSFRNEAVFSTVVSKLPRFDAIETPGLDPLDVLRDLRRMFPSRKLDRKNQTAKLGGRVRDDRFNGVERVVRCNIGVANQVSKRLKQSSLHLLGFRTPVLKAGIFGDGLVHICRVNTDHLSTSRRVVGKLRRVMNQFPQRDLQV